LVLDLVLGYMIEANYRCSLLLLVSSSGEGGCYDHGLNVQHNLKIENRREAVFLFVQVIFSRHVRLWPSADLGECDALLLVAIGP
jgi:hypothetical protein